MEERHFIEGSRVAWERLAASVEDARAHGVTRLGVRRLRVMHDDYRSTASDLAYAQTHYPGSETTSYLNLLVSQAHGELYGSRPGRARALRRFLAHGYPRLVRERWRPIASSAAILFGAAAVGYLLASLDYGLARLFVPASFQEAIGDTAQRTGEVGDITAALAPLLSAFITANNIQVSFLAFAGGMTFGVLTAYALVRNGLMLGALAGMYAAAGLDLEFWSLIVPHGALELTAICIAGGSGLMLGRALLFPGDLPRARAVRKVAPDAARIVLGTIPLFIVAGIVEGFFTPLPFDPYVKIAAGWGILGVVVLYIALAGRRAGSAG